MSECREHRDHISALSTRKAADASGGSYADVLHDLRGAYRSDPWK